MLIQELLKKKIIDKNTAKELENEAKTSGRKEEEVILEKKIAGEDFLFGLKGTILKIPLKVVSVDDVSLKALEIIPEESSKYYKIIPISKEDNFFEIGMVYPEDLKAREALEFLARQSDFSYKIFLITPTNFEEILKKYRSLKKEVTRALEELKDELEPSEEKKPKSGAMDTKAAAVERMAEEAPISKVVAVILRHAVEGNASDIHIEPTRERIRVRFRMDGELHASLFLPLDLLAAIVARIKILCDMKIDESRIPQDGRFSAKIENRDIDFRVSTFPTPLGEKVVIRILDPTKRDVSFKALGISGRNLKILERSFEKSYGMILATGPTGSGKTTTLYSILKILNTEEVNTVTLEDPVEYYMEGVNQSQIRPEIDYTFATGLRSIVRQDPDIIMVGEIRDQETATLAIHAALTGHIVLSTLHTSNTVGVIPRLIDMGVQPFLIQPTLNIAIAQRLLRKLCAYCRKKVKPSPEVLSAMEAELARIPAEARKEYDIPSTVDYVYEPVGCKRCNQIGYSGRVGIYEMLEMTKEMGEVINKEPTGMAIEAQARKQGMVTMKQDGILKVLEGATSFEEVLGVAEEK